ncbi:TetR/AcrR family transcriptional regulator [Mycobacterium intracellulare]|uniref:TetR/AcrR family transcriptional regulator n=1 Tax=Mycobacterium intracellulare TaxID=1767 RepID=A0AAE4U2U5_MYCIT|nr:TetR/AcrR family transcriptional regulator [Mycobacterium intracellulare]MDV6976873.1 TetR/AcrR family transcriptional regulator [Mycobacterium intracellulare]MDV6982170.1 TetR/AcrR family transcriptional regulator [Mycobacterium intracellulare]MDV7012045.1 TetR/AcrR family transcriptional regulator [Mycobacterium intracellulare]MDV7026981.1 TetR/AcrR family transcriptional regulator [Mycobacterium intracellulare]
MAANGDMLARIFDATTTTLARSGAKGLSMTDVSAQAGIPRGTLYHYFGRKQDLLYAVGVRVVKLFEGAVVNAVEERPELDVRVRAVVEAMIDVGRAHPEIMQVIALEPGFGVDFLQQIFPEFVGVLEELLAPALSLTLGVRSMGMTSGQLCELILRIVMSAYVFPTRDVADLPRAILAMPYLARWTPDQYLV